MARPGWERLPGSAERYRNLETGDEVSRRQYDNSRYADAGWRNRADFERRYDDKTYRWALERLAQREGKSIRQLDRVGSPAQRQVLKARAAGYGKGRTGRGAKGDMAQLLAAMGLRDPGATNRVGGTNPRRRARGGRR
jgi:hypothetical protein